MVKCWSHSPVQRPLAREALEFVSRAITDASGTSSKRIYEERPVTGEDVSSNEQPVRVSRKPQDAVEIVQELPGDGDQPSQLPRLLITPLSSNRANIVVFGEIGSGKSSLVNLILGSNQAQASSLSRSCTLDARRYDIIVQNRSFRIYDTVGLNDTQSLEDPDSLVSPINKGYRLVKSLAEEGGINLLIFCVRKGRITTSTQNNYKIFQDFFCQKKVPVVLVVTHCDDDATDAWLEKNHEEFTYHGMRTVAQACITANPKFAALYDISRQKIFALLLSHSSGEGFIMEKASRVAELIRSISGMVGVRPRIETLKARAQKLREFGLADNEIGIVLKRISSMDKDLETVKKLRR